MRLVIQRVKEASVTIDGKVVSAIGQGLFILVGVENGDTEADMEWLAAKAAGLRIFNDEDGVMNRSVVDVDGQLLAVSQFTLTASTKKGNRPSYIRAAGHELAVPLYDKFCIRLSKIAGRPVQKNVRTFGYIKQIALYLQYKIKIKENGTIYSYNSCG